MSPKTIFVQPSDVWLFRDARPFAAGEQNRASSIFPPTPRTIQGAIRSARLAQSGEPFDYRRWSNSLKAEIGEPENFGSLNLRGPLLVQREDADAVTVRRFFSHPADLVMLQSGWHILSPCIDAGYQLLANWPLNAPFKPLLPPEDAEPKKFKTGWLDEDAFTNYLGGCAPLEKNFDDGTDEQKCEDFAGSVTPSSCLFEREPRFGVQIDSTPKRPEEANLYQVEFIRLKPKVGLLIEVEGVNLGDNGLLQIGGESRAGRYEQSEVGISLPINERLKDRDNPLRFKLYLAVPALFKQGWLPEKINCRTLKGNWCGIDLKLVAAALHKPKPIGGRDISKRDVQRTVYRAVPEGSVYFFETTNATAQQVLDAFDGKCISDVDSQIGFGLSYVGGW